MVVETMVVIMNRQVAVTAAIVVAKEVVTVALEVKWTSG